MSVPQIPTASVSTNTGPSLSGGSPTSESSADPALSGMTVSAFMGGTSSSLVSLPSCGASATRSAGVPCDVGPLPFRRPGHGGQHGDGVIDDTPTAGRLCLFRLCPGGQRV